MFSDFSLIVWWFLSGFLFEFWNDSFLTFFPMVLMDEDKWEKADIRKIVNVYIENEIYRVMIHVVQMFILCTKIEQGFFFLACFNQTRFRLRDFFGGYKSCLYACINYHLSSCFAFWLKGFCYGGCKSLFGGWCIISKILEA